MSTKLFDGFYKMFSFQLPDAYNVFWASRKDIPFRDGNQEADAVSILATQGNRVVVLKQYRPVIDAWTYEFPAGKVDKDEKPILAARRELFEETGLYLDRVSAKVRDFVFPTVGLTDECHTVVRGVCSGLLSVQDNEDHEKILPMLATDEDLVQIYHSGSPISLGLCQYIEGKGIL